MTIPPTKMMIPSTKKLLSLTLLAGYLLCSGQLGHAGLLYQFSLTRQAIPGGAIGYEGGSGSLSLTGTMEIADLGPVVAADIIDFNLTVDLFGGGGVKGAYPTSPGDFSQSFLSANTSWQDGFGAFAGPGMIATESALILPALRQGDLGISFSAVPKKDGNGIAMWNCDWSVGSNDACRLRIFGFPYDPLFPEYPSTAFLEFGFVDDICSPCFSELARVGYNGSRYITGTEEAREVVLASRIGLPNDPSEVPAPHSAMLLGLGILLLTTRKTGVNAKNSALCQ